jgi:hypothetical protein
MKILPKVVIFILVLFAVNFSFAQKKGQNKGKFSEKYEKKKKAAKKTLAVDASTFLEQRVEGLREVMDSPRKIRVSLVQYYGKRERNYINFLLQQLSNDDFPSITTDADSIVFHYQDKKVKVRVVSYISQRFVINNDLEFSLKDFDSLSSYLDLMIPKLEVIINTSSWFKFELIKSAHASTPMLASAIVLTLIHIFHSREKNCGSFFEAVTDELKDLYGRCEMEKENLNPNNKKFINKIFKRWENYKSITYITDKTKNPCEKFGIYLDNETSASCNYRKSFIVKDNSTCQALKKVSLCINSVKDMITKVQK